MRTETIRSETMRLETVQVINEVISERVRQDEKWGGPDHDDTHNPYEWTGFIREHTGLARAGAAGAEGCDYRAELIKVAALAVAAVESYDRKRGK